MKILGIGTDIVNIKRLDKIFKKRGIKYKKRIFTKNEIKYCDGKINSCAFYAKRFAAKEAFSKALGTGIGNNVHFKNIEILNDKFGKPFINIKGSTNSILMKKIRNKKYNIFLSISDDSPFAQATVIISCN